MLFSSSFAPPPPQLHGSTLLNSAQLRCSTLLNSTLLSSAQLCSTLVLHRLCAARGYRAFVRPGILSAPSLSSASACPLPSPLRGSGRAYLHPPTLRGQLVGRGVVVHAVVLPRPSGSRRGCAEPLTLVLRRWRRSAAGRRWRGRGGAPGLRAALGRPREAERPRLGRSCAPRAPATAPRRRPQS